MPKKKITEEPVPEVNAVPEPEETVTATEPSVQPDPVLSSGEEGQAEIAADAECSDTSENDSIGLDDDELYDEPEVISLIPVPDVAPVKEDGGEDTAPDPATPYVETEGNVEEPLFVDTAESATSDIVPIPKEELLKSSDADEEDIPADESLEDGEDDGEPPPHSLSEEEARKAFFALDFNELDRDLTPEQRQEWNSIYASCRGRSVMSGKIMGVDPYQVFMKDRKTGVSEWRQFLCAVVVPFRVRILIPETEMWQRGRERPDFVMQRTTGATIDFVITHVYREEGFAIGSRRLATRNRRYFFSRREELNTPGTRVDCQLLAVGPRRCLVTCYGYDVGLTQREMSYTAIPDLRDEYHVGQVLPCIVKSYDALRSRLLISVKETEPNPYDGAEFRHPVESRRLAVISGKYGGGVFCTLPDDVTVMCNYSFQYEDAAFQIGDSVILMIQRYEDDKKQIYGKILAKC